MQAFKICLISTFNERKTANKLVLCMSDPLLMIGGEVGDMEGQALLAGGGSVGRDGGDESCSSSSEELSNVKSMTSTFLLLLPLLPSWLDNEELR